MHRVLSHLPSLSLSLSLPLSLSLSLCLFSSSILSFSLFLYFTRSLFQVWLSLSLSFSLSLLCCIGWRPWGLFDWSAGRVSVHWVICRGHSAVCRQRDRGVCVCMCVCVLKTISLAIYVLYKTICFEQQCAHTCVIRVNRQAVAMVTTIAWQTNTNSVFSF